MAKVLPAHLSDRRLISVSRFGVAGGSSTLLMDRLFGDGTLQVSDDHVSMICSGANASYQLRLRLPQPEMASGLGAYIRLRGWQSIKYIGVGYTRDGVFQHVKAQNPALDRWFDFLVGHHDLAWGWRNDWVHPEDCEIPDIRLYIKGTPGTSALLDVSEMLCWQEDSESVEEHLGPVRRLPPRVLHAVRDYETQCFRNYATQAQAFLDTGECPLFGDIMLDWPATAELPPELQETGTYQFSWHALHAATMLILQASDTGEIAPICAARELVANWLRRSYFQPDPNVKYTWYDHGTAERCLAFVQMYDVAQAHDFDHRFMAQLRLAIYRHAQLLASEVFYAGHQPTRYHNHAWFQDLALLAVTLAFPTWPCAERWADTAVWRLEDQFEKLIRRDNGHAVFVENSIGYHHGVLRIVEFAGTLATLSGRVTMIPDVAAELRRFADFFRYPDTRRTMSQGDTFRIPNSERPNPRGKSPYGASEVTVLPVAGYGIVKSDHAGHPFMLTMLATALSRTHKHEDNLSFTLYFDGVEWLIDPSFHSHEYSAPIPAYLRSAAAHNGVFVPELSYSIEPGLARLDGGQEGGICRLSGTHEGYEGVIVSRRLTCALDQLEIAGVDALSTPCVGAQLRFHCGEHVSAQVVEGKVSLTHPGSDFTLVLDIGEALVERVRGNIEAGSRMGGIVGHGFLEQDNIDTLIVDLGEKTELAWRLRVAGA